MTLSSFESGAIPSVELRQAKLSVATQTVSLRAEVGEFPAFKTRKQWRSKPCDVQCWLLRQRHRTQQSSARRALAGWESISGEAEARSCLSAEC